jgi:hypothetical protein
MADTKKNAATAILPPGTIPNKAAERPTRPNIEIIKPA